MTEETEDDSRAIPVVVDRILSFIVPVDATECAASLSSGLQDQGCRPIAPGRVFL